MKTFNLLNIEILKIELFKFIILLVCYNSVVIANLKDIISNEESPRVNWTIEYDGQLVEFALDFSSAAYAKDPTLCLAKHGAVLEKMDKIPCDHLHNECWVFIARNAEWIIFSVRGTQTALQLITEFVESMSAPKHKFPGGGSVQRYFYHAFQEIWNNGYGDKLRELNLQYPQCRLLFTGHSLGGAVSSLASSYFALESSNMTGFDSKRDILLITFGQPRVGNIDYAKAHDLYIPNSWRLVHRYDVVPHLPMCYQRLLSHSCTPLHNHGPFHHGTEIWYPDEMNITDALYRICDDTPTNEDNSCSNKYLVRYNINDHLSYFEKDISNYGSEGCKSNNTEQIASSILVDSSEEIQENGSKHWPRRHRRHEKTKKH